ncbi:TetR/AcrR family transcriptional regulator [Pseudoxanthomonas winnipegensis]|uniref:TetR/AcrR family transcriptional regulator n=1 Tax=Pseudoxanthomonas winnipegensis TaxID=2480810 RepID=A0A4Q8LD28_9GAMM|nr:TetR/AcrR family transcriptional regulator [Pseudoxanthomonas winnipegensis]TAA26804.1 TetR/AcrR family transcriptional regulator [Pseudoxanthomonas winnipegensis]
MTKAPSHRPRPRGRPTKDQPDGRQALLAAATASFARSGFDGADIRTIAAAAGVSPSLVRVHFGGKAVLWDACVGQLAQDMQPRLAAMARLTAHDARPLRERLADAIVLMATFYETHPAVRDFVARVVSESPDRAAAVTEHLLRPAYEAGQALILAGIEAGIVKATHPALFFVLLNSMLSQPPEFPQLLARLAPEIDAGQARARLVDTVLATLLHAPPRDRGAAPTAPRRASQEGIP